MADDWKVEEKKRLDAKELLLKDDLKRGNIRSCINCEHFTTKDETCFLFNNAQPPLVVKFHGCTSWEMEIPF